MRLFFVHFGDDSRRIVRVELEDGQGEITCPCCDEVAGLETTYSIQAEQPPKICRICDSVLVEHFVVAGNKHSTQDRASLFLVGTPPKITLPPAVAQAGPA